MGGRNASLVLAAGMVAMASIAGPALAGGERRSRATGGERIVPPRADRRDKSASLSSMLAKGRRRGRC